eukprot:102229-Pleurochrysis_carterae.AAC.1
MHVHRLHAPALVARHEDGCVLRVLRPEPRVALEVDLPDLAVRVADVDERVGVLHRELRDVDVLAVA